MSGDNVFIILMMAALLWIVVGSLRAGVAAERDRQERAWRKYFEEED